MPPMPTLTPATDTERMLKQRFVRYSAHLTTLAALAEVLEVPPATVADWAGRRLRGQPMSRDALRLAWLEFKRSGEIAHYFRHDGRGRWSDADFDDLLDYAGKMPLAQVARVVRRTRRACEEQLRRIEPWTPRITLGSLLRKLRPAAPIIAAWQDNRLRHFKEGRLIYIHREDARWLLKYYKPGVAIPRHPGKEL
jgi:hypothetical protein